MKVRGIILISTIFIFVASVFLYMNAMYVDPYTVAESFVDEARQNSINSSLILGNEHNLEHFLSFINRDEVTSWSITKLSLEDKLKNFGREDIKLHVYTYDFNGNENGYVPIELTKVQDQWKVIVTN